MSTRTYMQICTVHTFTNCNCNWSTCIAPPTRRPRAHHRVHPYPGVRRQNETEMFSDHDKMSPSIAAVSAPSLWRHSHKWLKLWSQGITANWLGARDNCLVQKSSEDSARHFVKFRGSPWQITVTSAVDNQRNKNHLSRSESNIIF